mmetsp:Transcript_41233/g.54177  ORF Transcript_41233/g.54177 Transcript_41233/m.54177 type:complete len:114 (+) Transcript_41233:44-385(+)
MAMEKARHRMDLRTTIGQKNDLSMRKKSEPSPDNFAAAGADLLQVGPMSFSNKQRVVAGTQLTTKEEKGSTLTMPKFSKTRIETAKTSVLGSSILQERTLDSEVRANSMTGER